MINDKNIKVITYGTFDLLHYGHIRLLERAKQLGDYLIVGVTSDNFDKQRGKINTQQSLMERMAAVQALGIADEIIVEEYVGQKIDDIKRYDIDIFTVGSDWVGTFDYLREYCEVIYLERTKGISSSNIRSDIRSLRIGIVGNKESKFKKESEYVNGVTVVESGDEMDALYINSLPNNHYMDVYTGLMSGKHVICETPIATTEEQAKELFSISQKKNLVLMDGIKTAYSTAYSRLLLLIKSGAIGDVVSVDSVCTSLADTGYSRGETEGHWSTMCAWGPTALLPIFQILGTEYIDKNIVSTFVDCNHKYDGFTKIDFVYPRAVASVKIAKAAKSEGSLVITGTKGYMYVPAPWWKTDYFEFRSENAEDTKRYFYQLDGEGIRYEIVAFEKAISTKKDFNYVSSDISVAIAKVIEDAKFCKTL